MAMPNRCSNYFTAYNEDSELMAELHEKIINEQNQLDYNLIFPMPEELNLPRWPVDVISDWASKADHVLEKRPYIMTDQWLAQRTPEEAAKYVQDCIKTTQRESENKAIIEKYWTDDWYTWSCDNRWCKWNSLEDVGDAINDNHTEICITFNSPWSPPEKWFAKLCETFPTIRMSLEYEEPGMWFEWTMESDWRGWYNDDQREYIAQCDHCDEKIEWTQRDDDLDCSICPECKQELIDDMHNDQDRISSPHVVAKADHVWE